MQLKRQLKRTARRFHLRPALSLWATTALTQLGHRTAVNTIQKCILIRTKRDIFRAWFKYTQCAVKLRQNAETIQYRTTIIKKYHILCKWIQCMDSRVNRNKYQQVQELRYYYLQKRTLFYWHKISLISEMCTWRSTRSVVRNWRLSTRINIKLRQSFIKSERYYDAYRAQISLYIWYRSVSQKSALLRRHHKAFRLLLLRKYLTSFRVWKRRMYLVYRVRHLLTPLQQQPAQFNMKRSLYKWQR